MKDFFVEDILEKFEDYTQPVNQGPRNMYVAGGVIKAAKKFLTQTPKPKPSILKREAVPLNLTQINEISKNKEFEQAWKNYKISIRKVGRRKYNKDQFFEVWARENMAQGGRIGQLVQPSIDGSRPGYSGNPLKKYLINNNGRRLGVEKMGTVPESSSKIIHSVYRDKKTGKEIDVYKVKITDKPSQIEGKMKAGKGGDYKTLLSGPDKTEFSTLKEAELARDNYYKENPLKRPKGSKNENKKKARKLRKNRLKITDPSGAEGVTKYPFHHIRQIGGDVPLTTDDIAIIDQRMNSVMSQYNEPLNRIADSIAKNNKLALEAMNSQNENVALKYMKRVEELNNEAESLVKSAIKKLPNEYKNLIGFNQFSLPTNEYGFPIGNEPLLVKKVGGAPVTKDAVPLTDLTLKQEQALRTQIKTDAKAGKTGIRFPDKIKKKLIKLGCGMYAGGRVGFKTGSGTCVTRALEKMDNPKGLSKIESKLAREVVAESSKLKTAGNWLKGDLYFGGADMLNNWSKGQGFLRGLNNAVAEATLGAIDVNADEAALSNLIQEQGSEEDKEAFEGYLDAAKKFNTYLDAEKGLTESEEVASLAKNLGPKDGVFFPVETEGAINANKRSLAERRKQAEEAGNNPLLDKGYNTMNEYMERLAAQDFNKTAGTLLDRGYREMIGVKGDEGLVWGPTFGTPLREANFKKFRPQDIMNYHPVYGYKEDLKKEMRRGNSPMEDILYSMDEYGPSDKLQLEAENDPMGTYDYDQRYAEGGLANLMKKYYD